MKGQPGAIAMIMAGECYRPSALLQCASASSNHHGKIQVFARGRRRSAGNRISANSFNRPSSFRFRFRLTSPVRRRHGHPSNDSSRRQARMSSKPHIVMIWRHFIVLRTMTCPATTAPPTSPLFTANTTPPADQPHRWTLFSRLFFQQRPAASLSACGTATGTKEESLGKRVHDGAAGQRGQEVASPSRQMRHLNRNIKISAAER